jgi:hypothetical protein
VTVYVWRVNSKLEEQQQCTIPPICGLEPIMISPPSWLQLNFGVFSVNTGSWLRHYATSRKVAVSIPDEVDFFNWFNPSNLTIALGTTQPQTEMSTRNLPGE